MNNAAGCAVVEPEASFIIGTLAAVIYLLCSHFLEAMKVDDMVRKDHEQRWGLAHLGLKRTYDYRNPIFFLMMGLCMGWLSWEHSNRSCCIPPFKTGRLRLLSSCEEAAEDKERNNGLLCEF